MKYNEQTVILCHTIGNAHIQTIFLFPSFNRKCFIKFELLIFMLLLLKYCVKIYQGPRYPISHLILSIHLLETNQLCAVCCLGVLDIHHGRRSVYYTHFLLRRRTKKLVENRFIIRPIYIFPIKFGWEII